MTNLFKNKIDIRLAKETEDGLRNLCNKTNEIRIKQGETPLSLWKFMHQEVQSFLDKQDASLKQTSLSKGPR